MAYGVGGMGLHGGGRGRGGGGLHADRERTPDVDGPRPALAPVLKRFWPFIASYRNAIIVGISCVVIASLLQKVGPLILRYVVDHVLTPVLRQPHDAVLRSRAVHLLALGVGAMFLLSALEALIARLRAFTMHRAGAAMVTDLRVQLYRHVQRLSLRYFESRQTGDIMSRITGDVGAMEQLITHVSDSVLTDLLNLVVTLVILLVLSWKLALAALVPAPILILLVTRFARVVRPVYRRVRNRVGDISAKLQDNLAGIRVIKAFHTEDEEIRRFQAENTSCLDEQVRGIRLWTSTVPLLRFIQSLGHILVTAIGGYMLLRPHPEISLGDLFAFNAYVIHLYDPIGSLFRAYDTALRSAAAGERIVEVLDAEPDVADAPDARELPPVRGQVRFENVSFEYRSGERVLSGVNIEAQPGDVVALVGRSGAGKTSIVNLIPRFYDPIEGRVTVDGFDVRQVTLRSLRSQIGIVLQDAFLFNGTVAANIRYARTEATDAELQAAAAAAYADEFIRKLPQGYDTEIGERGVKLSGGQRQRLSIARALLANRPILILDEATSMVDTEAERVIQQALERLMQGRTTFVIAHRLSTVRHAARIVALEEGEIVEVGDHETLLARNGAYAEMYQLQFQLALGEDSAVPDHGSPSDRPAPDPGAALPGLDLHAQG